MTRRVLTLACVLAAMGAAVWALSFFWSCPIYSITGHPCPGCGMTRAFFALLRLDFAGAWAANPAIFPLTLYGMVGAADYLVRGGVLLRRRWFWIGLGAVLVVVWLLGLAAGVLG